MDRIAEAVLSAIGGRQNVLTNTVCMTRLRVTLRNPQDVDYDALHNVPSVLGTATRGSNGLEVVFGPRVIDAIYHAFLRLTGIEAGSEPLFPMSRQDSNFKVKINTPSRARPIPLDHWGSNHMDQSDIDTLKSLFEQDEEEELDVSILEPESAFEEDEHDPCNLLVINGPNVNLIGLGIVINDEVNDFSAILELCKDTAREVGFARCVCLQSNHEGDLVDWVQDAWGDYDAIVINPTSYGTTSTALREAIRGVGIPTIRVSLLADDPSCLDDVCKQSIVGKGIKCYELAIRELGKICMS